MILSYDWVECPDSEFNKKMTEILVGKNIFEVKELGGKKYIRFKKDVDLNKLFGEGIIEELVGNQDLRKLAFE